MKLGGACAPVFRRVMNLWCSKKRILGMYCSGILFFMPMLAMQSPGLTLTAVAGSSAYVQPDKQEWAPFQGAIALQSGFLRTMYLSEVQGDQGADTATTRMLKELFFMGDNDQLKITTVKNRFGSCADAHDVGRIANLVQTQCVELALGARALGDFIKTKKITHLNDLNQRLKGGTPQPVLANALAMLAPHDMYDLQNKLALLENKLGMPEAKKRKLFMNFLGQLHGSLQESMPVGGQYARYTPQTILMGFLVAGAANRDDLADYFDTLCELGTPITTAAYDRNRFLQIVPAAKNTERVQELIDQLPESAVAQQPLKQCVEEQYETLATLGVLQWQYAIVSPFPDYAHVTIPVGQTTVTFADCVETSVRGFLNELLFSVHDGALHTALLDDLMQKNGDSAGSGSHMQDEIRRYYTHFNDVSMQHTAQAHEAWDSLWAEHADLSLVYNTTKHAQLCEVAAWHVSNPLTMLSHVFNMPIPKQITLASMCTFFQTITKRANESYARASIDKMIELQKVSAYHVDADGHWKTDEILGNACIDADDECELLLDAPVGMPRCGSLSLSFLVRSGDKKQQFSWHMEPKHFWLRVTPLAREYNTVRSRIMDVVPQLSQCLAQAAADESSVQQVTLASLYCTCDELAALAQVLSPAALTNFCWHQHVQDLMTSIELLKSNRAHAQATTLALAITKIALASEEEAFIAPCIALLNEPAWSPAHKENESFWRAIIERTVPAKSDTYNKAVMHAIARSVMHEPASTLLSVLQQRFAQTQQEYLLELKA